MINVQETNYKTHIFGDFVTFTPIKQPWEQKEFKKIKKMYSSYIHTTHTRTFENPVPSVVESEP